jgi:hypothetical protein
MAAFESPWLSEEEVLFHRMDSFHRQRVEAIGSGKTPQSVREGGLLIVHLFPLSSVRNRNHCDVPKLFEHGKEIPALGERGGDSRPNVDGLLIQKGTKDLRAYSQIFRDGRLEGVMSGITFLADRQEKNGVLGLCDSVCDKAVFGTIAGYLRFCQALELAPPIKMFSALLGCKGVKIYSDWTFHDTSEHSFDRSPLYLPEIEIGRLDVEVQTVLRPWCDSVWQACGFEKSHNFDEHGIWRERRS